MNTKVESMWSTTVMLLMRVALSTSKNSITRPTSTSRPLTVMYTGAPDTSRKENSSRLSVCAPSPR